MNYSLVQSRNNKFVSNIDRSQVYLILFKPFFFKPFYFLCLFLCPLSLYHCPSVCLTLPLSVSDLSLSVCLSLSLSLSVSLSFCLSLSISLCLSLICFFRSRIKYNPWIVNGSNLSGVLLV